MSDFPATIKVMGRRGVSRTRAESPLYDTRSSKASISKSKGRTSSPSSLAAHGPARSRNRHRDRSRGRSKHRDRSYEPPPSRQEIDDSASAASRSLHDLEIVDEDRGHREYIKKHNQYDAGSYDEERDDIDHQRSSRHNGEVPSSRNSRSRRRPKTSHAGARSNGGRRESGRRRQPTIHRRRGYYDDNDDEDEEDHYQKFEEENEVEYDSSPRKSRSRNPTKSRSNFRQSQQEPLQHKKETATDTDPFGFNLCQGSESFSDAETPGHSDARRSRYAHRLANTTMSTADGDYLDGPTFSEDHYPQSKPKQDHSYASIAITAIQLLVLMLQLALCGVAPLEVNPMVGPYPDAFSEWGGKNAYLILENQEYWRFITPAFLHVGVLHLLANAFCLLYSSALFEREWGSWTWLFIFFVSEVGCVGVSSVADPNTIAVGSSGALMGLFAAKLAHVLTYTFFDTNDMSQDEGIHVVQLSSVLCGLTLVSLLSSFTYVDWSGHMGGLASGFFAGMLVFASPIRSCCYSLLWGFLGLVGVAGTTVIIAYLLAKETDPFEELADPCEYFRHLFPEGYECGCYLW